jgi:hypothetical protein
VSRGVGVGLGRCRDILIICYIVLCSPCRVHRSTRSP